MAVGTSLTDQIGVGEETGGWGVYAAPTRWYKPVGRPDFKAGVNILEQLPHGQIIMDENDPRYYQFGGSGTLTVDARIKTIGLLIKAMLGAVSTSGAGPYTHIYTPLTNPGLSYTVQMGRTQIDGDKDPFNYLGCVMTALELTISADQNPRITTTWDVGGHEVSTALATAVYATGDRPFAYLDGAITKDGSAACLQSLMLRVERAMNTARQCIGGTKRQQVGNGELMLSGQAVAEYESRADYDKWLAGTSAALSLVLTLGTSSLTIAVPVIKYRAHDFSGGDNDVNTATLDFKGYKGSGALTTWTQVTSDSQP